MPIEQSENLNTNEKALFSDATSAPDNQPFDMPPTVVKAATHGPHTLHLGNRTITLVGTAHVSQESVDEVAKVISEVKPDVVAVELDEGRRKSMMDKDEWQKLDIISVLRRGDGFLLLANLALSSFQSQMGQDAGVTPGAEMLRAMQAADECGAHAVMVDRPIAVTLRRAWGLNSLWGKCRLLSEMLAMAFGGDGDVSAEDIEALKNSSEMDSMLQELSKTLPAVKTALIDERDRYLAAHIWEAGADASYMVRYTPPQAGHSPTIVAVLGAGHIPGVTAHLEKMARGEESTNTADIESVPKNIIGRFATVAIPVIIIALIAAGFAFGGRGAGGKMALGWVVWNGALAAIGAVAAVAHPLAILTSFVAAPLTSLCPLVGVGMASGIVQALVRKPTVADMETLTGDAASIKGWYHNKLLKVLVVFLLSSVGSSVGTFVAGAGLIKGLADVLGG